MLASLGRDCEEGLKHPMTVLPERLLCHTRTTDVCYNYETLLEVNVIKDPCYSAWPWPLGPSE